MSSPEDQQQVYYPAHRILRRINSLKRSSYDFPSQLIKCITGDGHDYPIYFVFQFGNVDDRDKMWFICYLHDVRICISLPLLSTEPVQVLGDLEYYGPGYRRFREELQNICRLCQRLPPSCTLNVSSLVPAANPTSSGPYETICGGSLNGSKVCAKKLRPFLIAGSGFDFVNFVTEVLCQDCSSHSDCPLLTGLIAPHGGGRQVETSDTPKYRSFPWRDKLAYPFCVGSGTRHRTK